MIKLTDILNEGVYDPGIFKAVFTAGGPGSGKSYTASSLFGMPEKMPFVSANGLKSVNSDKYFETYLQMKGLSQDIAKLDPAEYEQAMLLRTKSKKVRDAALRNYINGRLGLLIDGTGKNYSNISNQKKKLEAVGYDCFMIFVNTDLDVALQRNFERERKLPSELVKKSWQAVNNNMGKFQSLFGASNLLVVDNSVKKDFEDVVKANAREFVKRPIQNHIAKSWINKELKLRKS
jgi:tRNA uridine 5-carbamoylmethylation protein Kti12|tara:strand:- start:3792 stop:4493 length:702 start_codon:yes stop_codon:yes gene_type:complete